MKLLLFTGIGLASLAAVYCIFFTSVVDKIMLKIARHRVSAVVANLSTIKEEAERRQRQLSDMKNALEEDVKTAKKIAASVPLLNKKTKNKDTHEN